MLQNEDLSKIQFEVSQDYYFGIEGYQAKYGPFYTYYTHITEGTQVSQLNDALLADIAQLAIFSSPISNENALNNYLEFIDKLQNIEATDVLMYMACLLYAGLDVPVKTGELHLLKPYRKRDLTDNWSLKRGGMWEMKSWCSYNNVSPDSIFKSIGLGVKTLGKSCNATYTLIKIS